MSKLILGEISPLILAGLLYLGAGLAMMLILILRRLKGQPAFDNPITLRDWPAALTMILLDIAAPVLLLSGLQNTSAPSASLLNNF